MDADGLIARLQRDLRDYDDILTYRDAETGEGVVTDSDIAIADATADTGWPLPVTGPEQIRWFAHRAKRHMLFILLTGKAKKFQAKSFSLHHQFEHLKTLVDQMDVEFQRFIDSGGTAGNPLSVGGTVIGTGLSYDDLGREYEDPDNIGIFPSAL